MRVGEEVGPYNLMTHKYCEQRDKKNHKLINQAVFESTETLQEDNNGCQNICNKQNQYEITKSYLFYYKRDINPTTKINPTGTDVLRNCFIFYTENRCFDEWLENSRRTVVEAQRLYEAYI